MVTFLHGLLYDLESRTRGLLEHLEGGRDDPDLADHYLGAYQVIESVRRGAIRLLGDPALGIKDLVVNHLQMFRRWNERVALVEWFLLPILERYSDTDRWLTSLCRTLTKEVKWTLPDPIVGAFSTQYYWTMPHFGLIFVPAGENLSLLGLPDMCHELGHIAQVRGESDFAGTFPEKLEVYIRDERKRVATSQRPPDYSKLLDLLLSQWKDEWAKEFMADAVATYLVGPVYGWQHVRLCVGNGLSAFHPTLGEESTHPSDDARMRGILLALSQLRANGSSERMQALWDQHLDAGGEAKPPDYDTCYPQALIESVVQDALSGCAAMGLVPFEESLQVPGGLVALITNAWGEFLGNPEGFADWERKAIAELAKEF